MSAHGAAGLAPFNGGERPATVERIGRRWVELPEVGACR